MRHLALFIALIFPTEGWAGCTSAPSDPVPAFESVKAALLEGRYDDFLRAALPLNRDPLADRENLVGALERGFPEGLGPCHTVAERRDEPGMFQEITFFETAGTPIALYLQGARWNGEVVVLSFNYSDSVAEILNLLR